MVAGAVARVAADAAARAEEPAAVVVPRVAALELLSRDRETSLRR